MFVMLRFANFQGEYRGFSQDDLETGTDNKLHIRLLFPRENK